jgi:hypothetical protein
MGQAVISTTLCVASPRLGADAARDLHATDAQESEKHPWGQRERPSDNAAKKNATPCGPARPRYRLPRKLLWRDLS